MAGLKGNDRYVARRQVCPGGGGQRPLFVAKRRRNWIFWLKIALPAVAVVTVGYLVISSRRSAAPSSIRPC